MTKLLTLIAAASLGLTTLLSSSADAGFNIPLKLPADFSVMHNACDTDYRDDENDEEGYSASRSRSNQSARRANADADNEEETHRAARNPNQSIPRRHPKPTLEAPSRQIDRPAVTANAESKPARSPREEETAERENSSIATTHDEIATAERGGCRSYFASAGMTLPISCADDGGHR